MLRLAIIMRDFNIACEMIEAAAEAGADAVKFQTFKTEHYVSKKIWKDIRD